jgi:LPXTG-site transpeptidase (sortase) family protein
VGIGFIVWALVNIVAAAPRPPAPIVVRSNVSSPSAVPAAESSSATSATAVKQSKTVRRASYARNPAPGDTLGSLSIPALKQTWPIIEGTRTSDLKKGAGHYSKSVMPGQKDNCVLSAHRDTYFSRLGELKKGDRIAVETAAGTFTYRISGTRIVGKDDRTVIVPKDHGVLTLTTCYPFDYVGSAPKRYIVSADLVP